MRKIEISLQTAKNIREMIKTDICKNKKKLECPYCELFYNKKQRFLHCEKCFIKMLDRELKEKIRGEK